MCYEMEINNNSCLNQLSYGIDLGFRNFWETSFDEKIFITYEKTLIFNLYFAFKSSFFYKK